MLNFPVSANKNILYLLNQWTPLTLVFILIVAGCLASGPIGWAILGFVLLFNLIIRYRTINQSKDSLRTLLHQKSPEAAIAFYQQQFSKLKSPMADSMRALVIGQIYAFYGEFDSVRIQIDSINWESRPPMQAAGRLSLQCLLEYFEFRDYEKGLALARQARELGKLPLIFPGAKQAKKSFDTYVEIGEILTQTASQRTVKKLEAKLIETVGLSEPFISWGLAIAYAYSNQRAKLQVMRSLINSIAPDCKSLKTLPDLSR